MGARNRIRRGRRGRLWVWRYWVETAWWILILIWLCVAPLIEMVVTRLFWRPVGVRKEDGRVCWTCCVSILGLRFR